MKKKYGNISKNLDGTDYEQPLVSVIIACKNTALHIESCLRSVRNQTYKNIEIIIVDNYSRDGTFEIAKKYADIALQKGPERSTQFNYGFSKSSGKYIYRIGPDYVLEKNLIEICVNKMSEGYDALALHNRSVGDSIWAKVRFYERESYRNDDSIVGVRFMKANVFKKVGMFDETLVAGEDYDLHNRIVGAGYKWAHADAVENHIGEPRNILEVWSKFYYYGRTIRRYQQKNKRVSRKQLAFFRPSFKKLQIDLVKQPHLFVSFWLYMFVKYVAGATGMFVGAPRSLSSTKGKLDYDNHDGNLNKIFYHIEFAKTGLGMSGGEAWMVTILKQLNKRGHRNILFTTDNGRQSYEKLGLIHGKQVEYRVIKSFKAEKRLPLIISYLTRTIQAIRLVRSADITDGYVISHSDFFPNTIPFLFASKKVAPRNRVCMMHIVCPKLFRGYENHFKGGFKMPNIRFIHHKLNQELCFLILRLTKALILTNSEDNENRLKKICKKNQVTNLVHFAATEIKPPKKMPKKDIDIIWVGRFHKQKGVLDLPKIISEVSKFIPDVKAIIVGGGSEKILRELKQDISDLRIEKNINLTGVVTGDEKNQLICKAKIFVMPSYFESHSIVMLETLILGTPMVAYDLPCHKPYRNGIDVVPMFDKKVFADHIVKLLANKREYDNLQQRMHKKAKKYSWESTASEFYNSITDRVAH